MVVFYYNLFDPSCRGTIMDPEYGMVDIHMNKGIYPLTHSSL